LALFFLATFALAPEQQELALAVLVEQVDLAAEQLLLAWSEQVDLEFEAGSAA
jgi:hypothetical protein